MQHTQRLLSSLAWRIALWGTLLLTLLAAVYAIIQLISALNNGVTV